MTRTSEPRRRSSISRSAVVGVVAGLTLGGGVALVAGLPSGLGALGAVGIARQAADDSPDTSSTNTVDDNATTTPGRVDEHEAHVRDALAPLVDDGTLTAEQVDAIVTALAEAGPMDGPGFDHRGPGPSLDVVADLLGLSVADLQSALADGQSLADIAAANGSSADALVEGLVADLKAHLDDEVASGEHTQDEADQILTDATARITAMVNGDMPAAGDMHGDMHGGMRGGPGHGPGVPGDPRHDGDDDADSGS